MLFPIKAGTCIKLLMKGLTPRSITSNAQAFRQSSQLATCTRSFGYTAFSSQGSSKNNILVKPITIPTYKAVAQSFATKAFQTEHSSDSHASLQSTHNDRGQIGANTHDENTDNNVDDSSDGESSA